MTNKKFYILGITLFFQINSFCQTIFFAESKVIDKKIPRTSESYQERFIRINDLDTTFFVDKFHLTHFWQPISNNLIIGSKAWMCGLLDLNDQNLDTLFYDRDFEIFGLTANNKKCYLTIHNSWLNESSDYNKAFDFYKYLEINLITKDVDTLKIFENINAIPIDLSPNGRFLSFFDYEYKSENDDEKYVLCIYDFQTDSISKIDSIVKSNNERYGDLYEKSIGNWNPNSDQYYFSKKDADTTIWRIYSYTVKSKSIIKELDVPEIQDCRFYAFENKYYILNQEKIIELMPNNEMRMIYKRKYKYDYINSPIRLINK